MNALRLVISSCLSHHGFTPETHYIGAPFIPTRRLSESASSESTSIQTSPECSLNKSSSFKESDSSSDFKAKENDSELSLGSPIFSSSPEINTPGSPNHKEDSSTTDSSSSKETSLISPESPSPSLLLRKRVAHTPVGRGKRLKRRKIPFTPNKWLKIDWKLYNHTLNARFVFYKSNIHNTCTYHFIFSLFMFIFVQDSLTYGKNFH